MFNKLFQKLSRIIKKKTGEYNFQQQLSETEICGLWNGIIIDLLGKKISGKTKALYFKDNTLYISVFNPVVAQELQLQKRRIIKEINFFFKKEVIKNIIFKI